MLILIVEFVLGRYRGSDTQYDTSADYPPQLDRTFAALVESWGARDRRPNEENALRWLECQAAPTLRASVHTQPSLPQISYVPVNDQVLGRQSNASYRIRQARPFVVASPHDSIMTYSWETAEPEPRILKALQALAGDVRCIGQASSMVRCQFHRQWEGLETRPVATTVRKIYPGYLDTLEDAYKRKEHPPRGASVPRQETPRRLPPRSVFGSHWVIYSDVQGRRPDLRRTAIATRALRAAILSSFDGASAPQVLSGHFDNTGSPLWRPHMAIWPLGNVGWQYADERLMGLAVCLPREVAARDEEALMRALAQLHRRSSRARHSGMEIEVKVNDTQRWRLAREPEPTKSSLRPERYLRAASTWSTVTPIVLNCLSGDRPDDQHRDIIRQLKQACRDVELPEPLRVVVHWNSAVRGSPGVVAAQRGFRGGRERDRPADSFFDRPLKPRPWEHWDVPHYLENRPLTHATVQWSQPVQGPISLGAGRFVGLGICLARE